MQREIEDQTITPEERLARLARDQDVKPVDFKTLLDNAPGGPQDESADDMIDAIYQWRRLGQELQAG